MEWISILKCPITGSNLRLITSNEIDELNTLATDKKLWRIDGEDMNAPLAAGLISEDNNYIYPIINDITILLKNLTIVKNNKYCISIDLDDDKELVRNFYNKKGWFTDEAGNYEDAVIYEDLRTVSKDYVRKCHDRVSRYLNPSGTYMLDAASGALQYDDYLQYSANYNYRVCVDFSFQALSEARKKLGKKGIYVLADMTNMPFKDNVMDGFVSLNTIYHIPKDEQVTAVKELYRLLKSGGKGIIVYDWFKHSPWMNFWMLPFRGFVFLKNRLLNVIGQLTGTKGAEKRLYFYTHHPEYFEKHLPPYQLVVWRSLSVHFMRYYIHSWLFGKQILEWVYKKEEQQPEKCGLKGEYPMFVFKK